MRNWVSTRALLPAAVTWISLLLINTQRTEAGGLSTELRAVNPLLQCCLPLSPRLLVHHCVPARVCWWQTCLQASALQRHTQPLLTLPHSHSGLFWSSLVLWRDLVFLNELLNICDCFLKSCIISQCISFCAPWSLPHSSFWLLHISHGYCHWPLWSLCFVLSWSSLSSYIQEQQAWCKVKPVQIFFRYSPSPGQSIRYSREADSFKCPCWSCQ